MDFFDFRPVCPALYDRRPEMRDRLPDLKDPYMLAIVDGQTVRDHAGSPIRLDATLELEQITDLVIPADGIGHTLRLDVRDRGNTLANGRIAYVPGAGLIEIDPISPPAPPQPPGVTIEDAPRPVAPLGAPSEPSAGALGAVFSFAGATIERIEALSRHHHEETRGSSAALLDLMATQHAATLQALTAALQLQTAQVQAATTAAAAATTAAAAAAPPAPPAPAPTFREKLEGWIDTAGSLIELGGGLVEMVGGLDGLKEKAGTLLKLAAGPGAVGEAMANHPANRAMDLVEAVVGAHLMKGQAANDAPEIVDAEAV